jgi:hypothetical protein
MHSALSDIDQLQQIPSPCPGPLGLACDGPNLWVGSGEMHRIYGLDARTGAVFEEAKAPNKPYGMCVTGDALRVIVAEGDDDDRYIRRYIFGKDFKSEKVPCPNLTGSFLAYDGDALFVSQRFDLQIVEIDDAGRALRTIATQRQVTGMTIVGGRFYTVGSTDVKDPDYRLTRIDARRERPEIVDLAAVPFVARGLAFDGTRFWTHDRDALRIVAFAPVEGT